MTRRASSRCSSSRSPRGLAHARRRRARADDPAPLVRVVQPNIGQEGVGDPDYAERVLATADRAQRHARPTPRLLVWPEGMVNDYVEDGYPDTGTSAAIRASSARASPRCSARTTSVLIGGNALVLRRERTAERREQFDLVRRSRRHARRAATTRRTSCPSANICRCGRCSTALGLSRLVPGDIDFVPGPGPRTLAVPGFGKVGHADLLRDHLLGPCRSIPPHRPDFLFNPSNDAWFGSWGPPQHLAQARLRAIEEGLPIVRATPTGISGGDRLPTAAARADPLRQGGRDRSAAARRARADAVLAPRQLAARSSLRAVLLLAVAIRRLRPLGALTYKESFICGMGTAALSSQPRG